MDKVFVSYTKTSELTATLLLDEVKIELDHIEFLTRTHGKSSTYVAGCRGHLCRYIERTRRREIRTKAIKETLPEGVVPDTRPRKEQYWDAVIASLVTCLHGGEVVLGADASAGLKMDETTRYIALMESISHKKLFVPDQRKLTDAIAS